MVTRLALMTMCVNARAAGAVEGVLAWATLMIEATLADAVVKTLQDEQMEVTFGICGG
jgi:hypothetical protein